MSNIYRKSGVLHPSLAPTWKTTFLVKKNQNYFLLHFPRPRDTNALARETKNT